MPVLLVEFAEVVLEGFELDLFVLAVLEMVL